MKNPNLHSPIAILGFGIEGRAALTFLRQQGFEEITICDKNPKIETGQRYPVQLGDHYLKGLDRFRTVIRSPGIPAHLPEIQAALKTGAHLTSMTWLTMEAAGGRVTAITGSNGKTTTAALTADILRRHYGKRLIVGGNDRAPILSEALRRPKDPILLEASSFQFADLTISPYIAAILNITPNHLDWHRNAGEYALAKNNLIAHQKKTDWAVLNVEDENTARLAAGTRAQQFTLGKSEGPHWAVWRNGNLIISFDDSAQPLISEAELIVKTHPVNLLCAAAIGVLHQVPIEAIRLAMTRFKGVPHRLEFVRELKTIQFYNDSACTTPESVLAGLRHFDPGHLILLLGGSGKKADFTELAATLVQKKVRVCLFGKESARIQKALTLAGGSSLVLHYDKSGDFKTIIEGAYKQAKERDTILLSPACASFDMFQNAKERGERFREIVENL